MFGETNVENLRSWDRFCAVYHGPIVAAFRSIRGVSPDEAEDLAQSFLTKLIDRNELTRWSGPQGTFRKYLYTAVRNHAFDAFRRRRRRPEEVAFGEGKEPVSDDAGLPDEDALYALGMLHLTLQHVRQHCELTGIGDAWRIFEALYLAPIISGRVAMSREELLREFTGRDRQFLTNRCVTVLRTIRRMLPDLVPPELSEQQRPGQRFAEWLQLLNQCDASHLGRLHLALRVTPPLREGAGQKRSLDMVDHDLDAEGFSPDELRLILSFRLDLPFASYLREARLPQSVADLTLRTLIKDTAAMPHAQLHPLLEALKNWAKQIVGGRDHDLPDEFAQLFYDLALALALVRGNGLRISSLSDDVIENNFRFAIAYEWLDGAIRSVLAQALRQLGQSASP